MMKTALKIAALRDDEFARALHIGFFNEPRVPAFFDVSSVDAPAFPFTCEPYELAKRCDRLAEVGEQVPVIFSAGAKPFVRTMTWGFVPYWASVADTQVPAQFAEAHDIQQNLEFREAFRRRRCLIPGRFVDQLKAPSDCDQSSETASEDLFTPDSLLPSADPDQLTEFVAAVWDMWTVPDGSRRVGFAVIGHQDGRGNWQALRVPRTEARLWLSSEQKPAELRFRLQEWNGWWHPSRVQSHGEFRQAS